MKDQNTQETPELADIPSTRAVENKHDGELGCSFPELEPANPVVAHGPYLKISRSGGTEYIPGVPQVYIPGWGGEA